MIRRAAAHMSIVFAVVALIALLVANPRSARAEVIRAIPLTPVIRLNVWVPPGFHTIRTTNLRGVTPDPVMHIWGATSPTGTPGQRCYSDDADGLNPICTITVSGFASVLHTILIYSYNDARAGIADVLADGAILAADLAFEGRRIPVSQGNFSYQTVLTAMPPPGGVLGDPYIYGFDAASPGTIWKTWDDDAAVGYNSKIVGTTAAPIGRIVVGSYSASSAVGFVNLYVNDYLNDSDQDGLGRLLEADLGLCDSTATSAACADPYFCAALTLPDTTPGKADMVRRCMADRDRDGIIDGFEVLGIDPECTSPGTPTCNPGCSPPGASCSPSWSGGNPLHLPTWGADPKVKDIFVETDFASMAGVNTLTEADIQWVADRFNAMGTDISAVSHQSGTSGYRLHVDIGKPCSSTICGNYGGSSPVPDIAYASRVVTDMDNVRRGTFRYFIAWNGPAGQAGTRGDSGVFGPAGPAGMNAFTHELGHSVGAEHDGAPGGEDANCKPHYSSIMNYAGDFTTFNAREALESFNPSRMVEFGSYVGIATDPSSYLDRLTADGIHHWWNFDWHASSRSVDWNFDDVHTSGTIRASPIQHETTDTGCNTHTLKYEPIATNHGVTDARIIRVGARLFAFYRRSTGEIWFAQGSVSGPDGSGSCPNPGGDDLDLEPRVKCMNWGVPSIVPGPSGTNISFSVAPWKTPSEDGFVIAWRGPTDNLRTAFMTVHPTTGAVTNLTGTQEHGLHASDPEVSVVWRTDGSATEKVIALFFADGGSYRWKTSVGAASPWIDRGIMHNESGLPLSAGAFRPAVLPWPDPEAGTSPFSGACGIFGTSDDRPAFFCHDRATDAWRLISLCYIPDASGICPIAPPSFPPVPPPPLLRRAPNLVYHQPRLVTGAPLSEGQGNFWAIVPQTTDGWARLFRSTLMRPDVAPWAGGLKSFQPMDAEAGGRNGSVFHAYEDRQLSAMKGIFVWWEGQANPPKERLDFAPFADGTYRATLKSYNDFALFERGICYGLRTATEDSSWCGPPHANTF